MTFFFLLNPKNFLDPGGLISHKFDSEKPKKKKKKAQKKLKQEASVPEPAQPEEPKPNFEYTKELKAQLQKYKQIQKENQELLARVAKEASAKHQEELEKLKLEAHRRRIEVAKTLLQMEEEEMVVLMLMMLDD